MPSIIIETHGKDLETNCIEYLKGFGYQPQIITRQDSMIPEKRDTFEYNEWLVCEGRK